MATTSSTTASGAGATSSNNLAAHQAAARVSSSKNRDGRHSSTKKVAPWVAGIFAALGVLLLGPWIWNKMSSSTEKALATKGSGTSSATQQITGGSSHDHEIHLTESWRTIITLKQGLTKTCTEWAPARPEDKANILDEYMLTGESGWVSRQETSGKPVDWIRLRAKDGTALALVHVLAC
jgi:hypothetical protein